MGNTQPSRSGHRRRRSSKRLSHYDAGEEEWLQKAPLLGQPSNKPGTTPRPASVKPDPLPLPANASGPTDPPDDHRRPSGEASNKLPSWPMPSLKPGPLPLPAVNAGGPTDPPYVRRPPGDVSNKPSWPLPNLKPGPSPLPAVNAGGPTDPPDVRRPRRRPAGYKPLPAHQIISVLKLRVSFLELLLKKQTKEIEEMKLKNSGVDTKVSELATKIDDLLLPAKNNDDKNLPPPPPPASATVVDVPDLIDMDDDHNDDGRCKPPAADIDSTPDSCDSVLDGLIMSNLPAAADIGSRPDVGDDSVPGRRQLGTNSVNSDRNLVRFEGYSDFVILFVVFLVFMVLGLIM